MNFKRKDVVRGTKLELGNEEKDHIRAVFLEDIAPKLMKLHARTGIISCEFAGSQYAKWTIHFNSRGSEFDIVGFEYDEDAEAIDLDL